MNEAEREHLRAEWKRKLADRATVLFYEIHNYSATAWLVRSAGLITDDEYDYYMRILYNKLMLYWSDPERGEHD